MRPSETRSSDSLTANSAKDLVGKRHLDPPLKDVARKPGPNTRNTWYGLSILQPGHREESESGSGRSHGGTNEPQPDILPASKDDELCPTSAGSFHYYACFSFIEGRLVI